MAKLNELVRLYLEFTEQIEAHPVLPFMENAGDVRAQISEACRALQDGLSPVVPMVRTATDGASTLLAFLEGYRDQVPGGRSVN